MTNLREPARACTCTLGSAAQCSNHLAMTAAAESTENLCYLSDNHIRDCSFEIREGGWTIWREGHQISNIVFGGV